ncbi:MAG: TRZ/ATZ family protein [Clostridiales bacterium]|jgi:fumarate hydratase subunit beta|nr:TRZ/ATZ family protein [Clostridiales bacterium]
MRIHTSELRERAPHLRAGDRLLLSGTVYTSRDAAHKRLFALLDAGKPLPYPLKDGVIYYSGATPAPDGLPIGACGPTTSGRMDPYAPRLHDLGICATIGKGRRSPVVVDAIRRNGGVYLCAIGGAGALAARSVVSCEVIAFEDLGCESVKKLEIRDFPLIVAIDCQGGDLYERPEPSPDITD